VAIREDSGSIGVGRRARPAVSRRWAALGALPLGASFAVVVIVSVLAAASGVLYVRAQSEQDAVLAAAQDSTFVSQLVARRLSGTISTLRTTVATTAGTPGIGGVFAGGTRCALTFPANALLPRGHLDILASDGSVACSSSLAGSGRPATTPDWLAAALQRPQLLAPVGDPYTGAHSILATAPIPGLGLVAVFADLGQLGASIASLYDSPRDYEFLVASADGRTVVTRSRDPARWVGVSLAATPFGRTASFPERPDVQGTPRLYGQAAVGGGLGWRVYVGADRSTAVAAATGLFLRQLVIILAGLLAVLAVMAATYRGLALPISQLSVAVRAATARGTAEPVVGRGPREVRSLARDFNGLIASVDRELAERRRAEDEVRQLNDDLEARVAQRTAELQASNAELETFSYSVSHDLRAPLRAVSGLTRIVMEQHGADLPDDARRLLSQSVESARRMGELIDALLMLSRLGRRELRRERVEPAELVEEVLRDLEPEIERRRIELRVGELAPMLADRALVRQVLANLLANAVKFTARQSSAVIEVGCRAGREPAEYFVRDNGAGFDPRYAGKLFQVFQRLHPDQEFSGTGIGLALCERIVRRHGGRIWAEGAVGGGATFTFTVDGAREP
jgi:signal transduction histidine kinase